MVEDSPPPFIVIRTARRRDIYERALELVGVVQQLEHTKARFHLKDRLDRVTTALVFENLEPHDFHGEWNYTIHTTPSA